MRKMISLLLLAALLLSGCTPTQLEPEATIPDTSPSTQPSDRPAEEAETAGVSSEELTDTSDLFSNRDLEGTYQESEAVSIQLSGSTASCDSPSVEIRGGEVTIHDEGVYLLRGTLDDGMIIVDTDKKSKVQLVLAGASICSQTCAPVYILQADKVFLTLEEGTENTLSNGGTFESRDDNDIDAAVFSKDDLTINGSGKLTISSPAGHGVVSKDELTITDGHFEVITASHGLCGKDSVCIAGGSFTIDSGKDGIHSETNDDESLGFVYIRDGSFTIRSEGDGISASAYMQLDGGSYDIITGGGSVNGAQHTSDDWGGFGGFGGGPGGMGGGPGGRRGGGSWYSGETDTASSEDSTSIKAIKAAKDLLINGGTYSIDSADDAIHANGFVTVNGGSFTIATGDDGFHADEALTIRSGTICITESYEGLEGLSIDISGGDITLTSSDDGLNAAGGNDQSGFGGYRGGDMFGASSDSFIIISGGTIFLDASGDGIDSNGNLTISGGSITVEGPTMGGNGSLDYGGSASISGGTLIITGSIDMAQSISSSGGQGVLAISTGNLSGGTTVEVSDADGKVLLSFTPQKSFACVIVSCPEMKVGQSYTISIGDVSQAFTAS